MMGHHIFDLGLENKALRCKLGEVDEKWLNESENRIKLTYDDVTKKQVYLR